MRLILNIDSGTKSDSIVEARSLRNWLNEESRSDMLANLQRENLKPDEAGGGFLEILSVVLAAPAFALFIKSFNIWLEQRAKVYEATKKNMKIEIKNSKGSILKIEIENFKNGDQGFIAELERFMEISKEENEN